jgi:5'-nucleotidase
LRRTRSSLAALVVASSALLGLPTAALADPVDPASASVPQSTPAADPAAAATDPAASAAATSAPAADPSTSAPADSSTSAPADPSTSAPATAAPATSAPAASAPSTTAPVPAGATVDPSVSAVTAAEAPAAASVPSVSPVTAAAAADVPVQIIGMNDFHGRISETTGSDSQLLSAPGPDGQYGTADDLKVVVGGAASVATTVNSVRGSFVGSGGEAGSSLFVGAGDLISASPFNSSVFKDEPTIEVLNAMGLDASSVGNHEFDRGTQELRRISAATDGLYSDDVTACEGVTRDVDGCFTDSTQRPFHGTDFEYLAANVVMKDTGAPMLPPFQVFDVAGGKKVALIGIVTDTTPTIVSPTGIADVEFIDEATAINRWVPVIQQLGVQAIGVLVHEGGQAGNAAPPVAAYDGCAGVEGPIRDINAKTSAAVDFIVSAHSHTAYNCLLPDPSGQPRLVTQAGYYGRLVTDIRLGLDAVTGDVDRTNGAYSAANVAVTRTAPDARVAAIVKYWDDKAKVAGDVVVGTATADILRSGSPSTNAPRDVESSLGNLVAQAQLEGAQGAGSGNPVIAFMNPGGLRTELTAGPVTYSELFNIQPFSNTVNTITLTGADIRQVLEQQFQKDQPRGSQLVLGTSAGFSYRYDLARPYGDRVDPCSVTLNGTVLAPGTSYRVAANSFLVGGGDSFAAFTKGTGPVTGPVDVDTAVAYFTAHSPVAPPAADHGTPSTQRGTCAGAPAGAVAGAGAGAGAGAAGGAPVAAPVAAPAVRPVAGGSSRPTGATGSGHAAATGSGTDSLAYTGSPVVGMLGLGGALLAAGGVLTAAGYRRRRGLAD